MTYYPYSDRKPEPFQEAAVGFPAVQLAGGGMGTVSGPIITWSTKPSINYALPKPQMTNNLSVPRQINAPAQHSMNNSRTSSGGGSYTQAQVLSNLQSALIQLSAMLATYQSSNNH